MTPPRPYSFRVYMTEWSRWVTFTEGVTDIPSVLDSVWRVVLDRGLRHEILDATPVSPR